MKDNLWHWGELLPQATTKPDIEDFDNELFSKIDTCTREILQNSCDAKSNNHDPVKVKFQTGIIKVNGNKLLSGLNEHRAVSGFKDPIGGNSGKVSYLLIADTATTGLKGDKNKRDSDFWNFFLNWGKSNKEGTNKKGLNGRGRITILEASSEKTIIVSTKRDAKEGPLVCGLSLFDQCKDTAGKERDYWAYLGKKSSTNKSVFDLHDGVMMYDLLSDLIDEDGQGLPDIPSIGTSILVIDHHKDITKERILSSSIEHFLPSFLEGKLEVEFDGTTVNAGNVIEVAKSFIGGKDYFRRESELSGPNAINYLSLVGRERSAKKTIIRLATPRRLKATDITSDELKILKDKFNNNDTLNFQIEFPLIHQENDEVEQQVSFDVCIKKTKGYSVENYFRDGMSIPGNKKQLKSFGMSGIVEIPDGELSKYLNLCEGKAHMQWRTTQKVKEILKEKGYSQGIKPRELCTLVLYDLAEKFFSEEDLNPDYFLLSDYFPSRESISSEQEKEDEAVITINEDTEIDDPDPENKPGEDRVVIVDKDPREDDTKIHKISDGLVLTGNFKKNKKRIKKFDFSVAFTTESGNPFALWSKFDFDFNKKASLVNVEKTDTIKAKHSFLVKDPKKEFKITLNGFDKTRDLSTLLEVTEIE